MAEIADVRAASGALRGQAGLRPVNPVDDPRRAPPVAAIEAGAATGAFAERGEAASRRAAIAGARDYL